MQTLTVPCSTMLFVVIFVVCAYLPLSRAGGVPVGPPSGLIPAAAPLAPAQLGADSMETLAPFVTAAGPASANNPSIQVTLSAPNDAVTMNSWAYLKQSMERVHDQVSDIMLVRNDIDSIRGDLKRQVEIWHQAELQLQDENQKLHFELKQQEAEYHSVSDPIKTLYSQLQVNIADEKRHGLGLQQELFQQSKEIDVEHSMLSARRQNLTTRLQQIGYDSVFDNQKIHNKELQLMTDGAALTLKSHELKDRLVDGVKQLSLEQTNFKNDQKSLAQQLVEMVGGLQRLKQHIFASAPETDADGKLRASLDEELKTSTQELLQLQQEHNQYSMQCGRNIQTIQQVAQVEESRLKARGVEAFQFCEPVKQQHGVLLQWISQCTGKPVSPDVSVGAVDVDAPPLPRIFHTPTGCSDHTDDVIFVPDLVMGCDASWRTGGLLGGSDACSQGFAMCTRERLTTLGLSGDHCKNYPDAGNFYAINYQIPNRPGDDIVGCAKNAPELSFYGPQADGEFKDFSYLGNHPFGSWNDMEGENSHQEFYKVKKGNGNGGVMCCREPDSIPATEPRPDCEEGILSVRIVGASRPGSASSAPVGSQILLRVGDTKFITGAGSGLSFLASTKEFKFPVVSQNALLELGVSQGAGAAACMLQSPVGLQMIRGAPGRWHTIKERLCDAAEGAELEFQAKFIPRQ